MATMMMHTVDPTGVTVGPPVGTDDKFGVQVGTGVLYLDRDEALALFHQLGDVLVATHPDAVPVPMCTCGHSPDKHIGSGADSGRPCIVPGAEYGGAFADDCLDFTPATETKESDRGE